MRSFDSEHRIFGSELEYVDSSTLFAAEQVVLT
ncbi:hypothetical protein [Rhizobium sp. 22-785-1]